MRGLLIHGAIGLGAAFSVAACAPQSAGPARAGVVVAEEPSARPEWQGIANEEDVKKIAGIEDAWREALGQARRFRSQIAAEGELLDPDAGLARPAPSPGPYRCRVVKLGSSDPRGRAFEAFKPFFCYVEAEGPLLTIVKQTGSQRPAGRLYPDDEKERLVFLGTLALGSEEAPLPYGEDPERDMAGVLERVAPFRYRLVIPFPPDKSTLQVIELVPATN